VISVILCTHNPREAHLNRALAALRAQSFSPEAWDFLVVDNRSSEPLHGRIDLSWHPRARTVREETLGLTPARLRGIRETKGELLVFVDDDNVLDPDYLQEANRIGRERPFLGSWSGQCLPDFEEEPPEWTRRYWGSLCIRSFDDEVWSNLPRLAQTMPAGAGLCVRREVAQRYLSLYENGVRQFQFDRTGTSLTSGGDNDLAACACDIGLGVGLQPSLRLKHLIPPERLTAGYLKSLSEGIHFSSVLLDAERGLAPSPRGLLGRLADTLRIMRSREPHRSLLRAAYRGRDKAVELITSAKGQQRLPKRAKCSPI